MSMMVLPFTRSLGVATILICVYVFALGSWSANMSAFKQEVSSGRVATVAALVGFCETGFSAFVVDKVGTLAKASGGFNAVFLLLGAFLSISAAMVYWLCRPRFFETGSVGDMNSAGTNGQSPSGPCDTDAIACAAEAGRSFHPHRAEG